MKLINLLLVCAALACASTAGAQVFVPRTGTLNSAQPIFCVDPATGTVKDCASATISVAPLTTTPAAGTVTTHGTFQTALASSGSRKGCLIQNTSTDVELVYFGANGSATTTNSIALAAAAATGGAGGAVTCAVGGLGVATDNIAITSKAADGATYVVNSQ